MKTYFLHNGSTQEGPFTLDELKTKGYTEITPIWYEGLQDWVPAGHVEELKIVTPPPYTRQTTVSTPPVYAPVPEKRKGRSFFKILTYVAGVLLFLWLGAMALSMYIESDRKRTEELSKESVRKNLSTYITADRNAYTYFPLGGIENLEITVNNHSKYPIDEVKVQVNYIKAGGGIFKTEILPFEYIFPNSSKTLRAPNSNRGTSIDYKIVSVKSKALGL